MKLSIVIPTYNRKDDLSKTLLSFENQELSRKDWEIIIVDNGPSTDGTRDFIKEFIKTSKLNVSYFCLSLQGVAYARSYGANCAKGDIIVQIDDDITLHSSKMLSRLISYFKESKIDVLGALELKSKDDLIKMRNLESDTCHDKHMFFDLDLFEVGRMDKNFNMYTGFEKLLEMPSGIYKCTSFRSCFMAARSRVYESVPWDSNYAIVGGKVSVREETDFLYRSSCEGFGIYYTNKLYFEHRCGDRDKSLNSRGDNFSKAYYYSCAHSYLITKAFLSKRISLQRFLCAWAYQSLIGGDKTKGFLMYLVKNKSFLCAVAVLLGYSRGVIYSLWFNKCKK